MMGELGRHGGYILASYAVTIGIMGGLIVLSILSFRRARRRLAALGEAHD